ncbi:hypothetical protein BCV69DRAFT_179183 [Microstroma glucosiphilum]|uniref:Uncharacterized protein n=1 Tax=Pseudomicrostroma glucosiphilum TaxID=1684307 RepID=A0A316U6P2_9BASI|nr:hypothetical protein BCV69DRAFT_179183 [Pseudomicrostroma glucosiphilum]PWN20937.1 hypothetical protein BCV69DRAFT_179183 [Pseudomicrostroma glucosiphilum]
MSSRSPLQHSVPLALPTMSTLEPSPDTTHSTPPLRIGFRPPSATSTRQSAKAKSKGVAPLELNLNATPSVPQSPSRRLRSLSRKAATADLRHSKSESTSSVHSPGFCVNTTPVPPPTIPPTPVSPSSPTSASIIPSLSSASRKLKSKSQKLLRKFSVPVWKLRGTGRAFGGKPTGRSPTIAPSDAEHHSQNTAEETPNFVSLYQLQSMPCRDFSSSPQYAQGRSVGLVSARTSTYGGGAHWEPELRKSQSLLELMRTRATRRDSMAYSQDDRSFGVLGGSPQTSELEHTVADVQLPQSQYQTTQKLSPVNEASFNKTAQDCGSAGDHQCPREDEYQQPNLARHVTSPGNLSRGFGEPQPSTSENLSRRGSQTTTRPEACRSHSDQTMVPVMPQDEDYPSRRMHSQEDGDKSSDDGPQTPIATSPMTSSTPAMMDHRDYHSTRTHRHGMLSSMTIQDAFAYDDVGRSTPNLLGSPSRASSNISPTRTSCSRGGTGTVAAGKHFQQPSNHSSRLSWEADHSDSAAKSIQEEVHIREQILAACARQEEYLQSFQQEYAKREASPRLLARGTAGDVGLAPHRISTVVSGSSEALLAIDLLDLRSKGLDEEAGLNSLGVPRFAKQADTASLHSGGKTLNERQRKTSLGQLFGLSQPSTRPARSPRLYPTLSRGGNAREKRS